MEFKSFKTIQPIEPKKSSLPLVAGILLILAGIIAIISWIPYITENQISTQIQLENFDLS